MPNPLLLPRRDPAAHPSQVRSIAPDGSPDPTHAEVAARAFEIYQQRGGEHGCDQSDWFRAERELRAARAGIGRARNRRRKEDRADG
ncbi:MAG: DUF2934 domain-containing protein [Gammaproteobacteria bacterium]|nr:MAG: DUF2934 domain-containing protein [Gammaproteobacteria bacterium]